jgi:hypothetical protein
MTIFQLEVKSNQTSNFEHLAQALSIPLFVLICLLTIRSTSKNTLPSYFSEKEQQKGKETTLDYHCRVC